MSEQLPTEIGSVVYVDKESVAGTLRTAYILGKHGVWYPISIGDGYLSAYEIEGFGWDSP